MFDLEADRFQNLEYAEDAFRTEAGAVLGEYNKSASNPFQPLDEKMRDLAFQKHTYKHTTIGFLADIKDMPNQYEYSLSFFDRFYRPDNSALLVVGDVQPERGVRAGGEALRRLAAGLSAAGGGRRGAAGGAAARAPRLAEPDQPLLDDRLPHAGLRRRPHLGGAAGRRAAALLASRRRSTRSWSSTSSGSTSSAATPIRTATPTSSASTPACAATS